MHHTHLCVPAAAAAQLFHVLYSRVEVHLVAGARLPPLVLGLKIPACRCEGTSPLSRLQRMLQRSRPHGACLGPVSASGHGARTYVLQSLCRLGRERVYPALKPSTGRDLDDVGRIHANIEAQHECDTRGLQLLFLTPLRHQPWVWPALVAVVRSPVVPLLHARMNVKAYCTPRACTCPACSVVRYAGGETRPPLLHQELLALPWDQYRRHPHLTQDTWW
jgi:hypothetical protein